MLRASRIAHIRVPKARRPKERPWEIANLRNIGVREGGQNYATWGWGCVVATCFISYESYYQWQRVVARGESCEACEASRRMYRERLKNSEVLTGGVFAHKGAALEGQKHTSI